MEADFLEGNLIHLFCAHQLNETEQRADGLRNRGGRGGRTDAHMKHADKKQIQHDVETGGKNEII